MQKEKTSCQNFLREITTFTLLQVFANLPANFFSTKQKIESIFHQKFCVWSRTKRKLLILPDWTWKSLAQFFDAEKEKKITFNGLETNPTQEENWSGKKCLQFFFRVKEREREMNWREISLVSSQWPALVSFWFRSSEASLVGAFQSLVDAKLIFAFDFGFRKRQSYVKRRLCV